MARGFESKSVEAQQEEAARPRRPERPEMSAEAKAAQERRRSLELTRTRAKHDLSRAVAPAHRRMLEEGIAALDRQIDELLAGADA